MPTPAPARDVLDLADFGYRQRLDRTLGGFSSFAAGFSYLSILTGLPQTFYLGFSAGGPAYFWTWPVVFLGQFLVALCFAELAARYPLSGGVYQWSKRIGPEPVGWMTGWVYLSCSVITLAAVALALQATLPQLWPGFQIIGTATNPADTARNAVLLGCVLLAVSTLINSIGVGLLARINNVGVFAELSGAVFLVVILTWSARRGPEIVLESQGRGVGETLGYLGPFLAAMLSSTYILYGFDTAGSLAEETDNPRRRAPRAILGALASVGLVGLLLILGTMRAVADPADPALGQLGGGMSYVIRQVLGERLGPGLLAVVVLAVTICTLTVHAAAVRLVFAMARDGVLPFASGLAHVSESTRTPTRPAVLLGGLAAVILVLNVDFSQVVEVMTSVSVIWANLAYLLVTLPMLMSRLRRDRPEEPSQPGLFSLGRWGLPINALAVAWGILVIVNTAWPRPEVYGEIWYRRFSAPLATAAMLGCGWVCHGLVHRRNAGVLEEHRAIAPAATDAIGGELA